MKRMHQYFMKINFNYIFLLEVNFVSILKLKNIIRMKQMINQTWSLYIGQIPFSNQKWICVWNAIQIIIKHQFNNQK
ncbi:unnamed protein product [Paramecium pentaurelia]|uniref:Uncharacterized protein n=1 Tax=Paramecium pentaurelia TaxID=43138 RepID=A0A8S1YJ16_9CILI|nr:unnamed protein product [Paramecium pentaurelia]